MAETPPAAEPPVVRPPGENPFWRTLRQPRIVLILLVAWAILAVLAEFFVDGKIRGPLGGMVLSWEGIPLAALYLYCARDPVRYQRVFWLALVQMAAAIAANIYHWGAGDLTPGSIIIPMAVSGGLAVLVFLHLFEPREAEPAATA
jgi:hypothetical protein